MGIFRHQKKTPADEAERVFDEKFQEELRNHGRWYFEKVISESGAIFKQDLDAVIGQIQGQLQEHMTQQLDQGLAQVNIELKGHITKQLEEKFAERSQALQEAQDAALQTMTAGVQAMQDQHQQLSTELQQKIAEQQGVLTEVFEESKAQITKMKDTQGLALQYLAQSVKAMQDQHQQLESQLQQNVAAQEAMLVGAYEQNMAKIIEHYLLATLGDQYDLKTQLPGIIKQMEANKQAITDDMKL
jgi:exonuclease VII large subunit